MRISNKPLFEYFKNKEPKCDLCRCSNCGWEGKTSDCETDEEGDWESGYYTIDLCPECDDGGCIDDYDMSDERLDEWDAWYLKCNTHKQYDIDT